MPLTEVLLSTGDATLKKRASVLTEKLRNLAGTMPRWRTCDGLIGPWGKRDASDDPAWMGAVAEPQAHFPFDVVLTDLS